MICVRCHAPDDNTAKTYKVKGRDSVLCDNCARFTATIRAISPTPPETPEVKAASLKALEAAAKRPEAPEAEAKKLGRPPGGN
jgi:hypothetical protein